MSNINEVLETADQLERMVVELRNLHGYSRPLAIKMVLELFKEMLGKTTDDGTNFLMIGVPDDSR